MTKDSVMAIGIIGMCSCKVKRSAPVNQLRIFINAAQLFFRNSDYKNRAHREPLFARARRAPL
ncbi:MAG TPA: hypothetical protein VKA60_16995 [Blastocatellia bacterium]|nr:hypothetical protein [Blastocatellia bacterium]